MIEQNTHIAMQERIESLREELKRLNELRIELRALERLQIQTRSSNGKRFGARRGVVTVLRDSPRSKSEIVELLAGKIETRSDNVRRLLHTTIGQMRDEGRIASRPDGALELVEA